jgi:Ulp1 family protease
MSNNFHSSLEEGYQSIRKWTLKVDLFKKKYIIVPINEKLVASIHALMQHAHCLVAFIGIWP